MNYINVVKRMIYGRTSHFVIKQGSTALRGVSFVELYRERTEYPMTILALDIKMEKNVVAQWNICVDGEKVFPYGETNQIPEGMVNIVPVEIAADSLLTVEVRGQPNASDVVILVEMDVIEFR